MEESPGRVCRVPEHRSWKGAGKPLFLLSPHCTVGQTEAQTGHRAGPRSAQLAPLTCVLGPAQDGGDLVALSGVALGALGRCAHPHGALIGLHPTQVGGGGARAIGDLGVGVVRLQVEKEGQDTARPRSTLLPPTPLTAWGLDTRETEASCGLGRALLPTKVPPPLEPPDPLAACLLPTPPPWQPG